MTVLASAATELDIVAALTQKLDSDRAAVWQRIRDYWQSINDTNHLNNVIGLSDKYTWDLYDDYGLVLTDFNYQTQSPQFTPEIVSERVFQNDGDTEAQEAFTFLKTSQDTFTFGFKEGLKVGAKAKVKVGIPAISEGEVEVSGEVTFDATQQWTDSTTKTWSVNDTIRIPAHQTVRARGYINDATISATFSGLVRATTGQVLVEYQWKDQTYGSTTIPLVAMLTQDQRKFSVSGTFQGTEGVSAYTKVERITIERVNNR